jgi:glycine hydroxymethyltransferase
MGTAEVERLAGWMDAVLQNTGDDAVRERVRHDVRELCGQFPVYG